MRFKKSITAGFTLVEVMVGMGVAAIGLLGTTGLVSWIVRGNAFDSQLVTATALGHQRLEDLGAQGFATLQSGSATNGYLSFGWTVTSHTAHAKSVDLTMRWESVDGSLHQFNLQTYLTDYGLMAELPDFLQPGFGGGSLP